MGNEIDALVLKWEKDMPQITEDERTEITEKVEEIRGWIVDKEKEQASKASHDEPAFLSKDVPLQLKDLEKKILKLSKRPKPKPPKKEKKSTNSTNTTSDDDNSTTTTSDNDETTTTTKTDDEEGGDKEGTSKDDDTTTTDETGNKEEESKDDKS